MRVKYLYIFILFLFTSIKCQAQSLELGLRDNQYIHINYIGKIKNPNNNWIIGYEQSLLNVKLKEQSGRLFVGYLFTKDQITFSGVVYGGSEYTSKWKIIGGNINGTYNYRYLKVAATLNPNYDSDLNFQFNYDLGLYFLVYKAKTAINQSLYITTSIGNIPEYRQNNEKLCIGLEFISGNLWVKPLISLPDIFNHHLEKHIRVLCNLGWRINWKKK